MCLEDRLYVTLKEDAMHIGTMAIHTASITRYSLLE